MTYPRYLLGLLCLLVGGAHPITVAATPVAPAWDGWTLEGAAWREGTGAKELTSPINYRPVSVVSPATPAHPGELFTASLPVATHWGGSPLHADFFSAWLELQFLQGEKLVRTVRSSEVKGTRPEQLLAVTAVAPEGTTAVRLSLHLLNKYWVVAPNAVRPGVPRLASVGGPRGNTVRLKVATPLPRAGGGRAAKLSLQGDWPDGTAVVLSSSRGTVPPAVLLRGGRAEFPLTYAATECGETRIVASVDGTPLPAVAVPDPYAGRLRVGQEGDSPVFVEVSREGKPLPGRYTPMPGFFVQPPWQMELAPGNWRVRVLRGAHHEPVVKDVDIRSGEEVGLKESRPRLAVDLRREGWYAGDADGDVYHGERIYTDVSAETAVTIGRAQGMDWLAAGSWGSPSFRTWGELSEILGRVSAPDHRFYWTDERPKSRQGHICMIGLRRPDQESFGAFWSGTAGLHNYEVLKAIRANGAATFTNHPLRWWMSGGKFNTNLYSALPFDLAAGLIDGVNINEGGDKALQLWSLLLDHGYPVAATGGADFCLDRPVGSLPGRMRLYVQSPEGPTAEGLAEGIRLGRTVVSTGPILLADLEGKLPGTRVTTGKQYRLRARAWARRDDDDPLQRVELWAHGKPLEARPVKAGDAEETFTWKPQGDWDWVAVRAVSRKGWAMTSAFYAAAPAWKAPEPARSRVTLTVTGIADVDRDKATVEAWDTWPDAPSARKLLSRPLGEGNRFYVPATATLVIRLADGREKRVRVYEASGAAAVVQDIASGRRKEEPLLQWETYENVLQSLSEVEAKATF